MNFWQKIDSFFLSELWWKIYFIIFIVYVVLEITTTIIDKYLERKAVKQFEEKAYKYGIPKDFEAPDSVWYHIGVLIELCEKYELDSLYEAQDKFDELFTAHWRSTKLSDEDMKDFQYPITTYISPFNELGACIPRVESKQFKYYGIFKLTEQRPDDYKEDKPDAQE